MVRVGEPLSFDDVVAVATRDARVELSPDAVARIEAARAVVERAADANAVVYGVTTGIGHLANVHIPHDDATRLQRDIVRSHATAVGERLPTEVVRAMLLLKARTLAAGYSGVRVEIVERLLELLNRRIHPEVPSRGSLGASGDLAPLAHLALPVIGDGRVEVEGTVLDTRDALKRAGLEPITLSFKEGLSLVNGTELMLASGILDTVAAESLVATADLTGAMSLEACLGTDRAFDPDIIGLRKHPGAITSAERMRAFLEGSEIVASHRESEHLVQDAYSLRCMPQVHGAYRDALAYVRTTLERELHSTIDNPSVFVGRDEVLSGGNFHGEALALALDHLTLAVAGVATIAERRIARLLDPALNNGLPAFLTPDPGRRSGFMLAQYTAAALVAENRTLCVPASADSIPTSAGQEDHVSMGATAALKASRVLANSRTVVAIEAIVAAQGLELRSPLKPAAATAAACREVRKVSPHLEEDRPLGDDIEAVAVLVAGGVLEASAFSGS
ncbi:MAG TPA: histidine ammonia-lyase [Actinomycetota bacterium]|nr:histidine ammonia-lyase [Actinomycetota bacterium]